MPRNKKSKMNIFCLFYIVGFAVPFSLAATRQETRLIGASNAALGEFPWIVSLQKDKNGTIKHFCAGSIVDETHIVTAAHCVWEKKAGDFFILAGSLFNVKPAEEGQFINISKVIVHPLYSSGDRAGQHDIAVLELAKRLVFGDHVGPIALPLQGQEAASGSACMHAGWGNRFFVSSMLYRGSDVLQKVISYAVPKSLCVLPYLLFYRQLETGFCTSGGPFRGSCQGDSGGPVTCLTPENTPYLAGIVSWGWLLCGDGVHPDVSTNVALYSNFLTQVLTSKKSTNSTVKSI